MQHTKHTSKIIFVWFVVRLGRVINWSLLWRQALSTVEDQSFANSFEYFMIYLFWVFIMHIVDVLTIYKTKQLQYDKTDREIVYRAVRIGFALFIVHNLGYDDIQFPLCGYKIQ